MGYVPLDVVGLILGIIPDVVDVQAVAELDVLELVEILAIMDVITLAMDAQMLVVDAPADVQMRV